MNFKQQMDWPELFNWRTPYNNFIAWDVVELTGYPDMTDENKYSVIKIQINS